ncbi:MAG: hypothetical protein IJ279_01495 [Clostridia bacterium]|nr:hypothetical protein [Clostridia bacterium]
MENNNKKKLNLNVDEWVVSNPVNGKSNQPVISKAKSPVGHSAPSGGVITDSKKNISRQNDNSKPTVKKKMDSQKKWTILLFVILIIGALVLGIAFLDQNSKKSITYDVAGQAGESEVYEEAEKVQEYLDMVNDGEVKPEKINNDIFSNLKNGSVIQLGSYPQAKVTDKELISTLSEMATDEDFFTDSNDYEGYGTIDDGAYNGIYGEADLSGSYSFCDVKLSDGRKFRGVKLMSYLPDYTARVSSENNSQQFKNGYFTGTMYWFEYQPLRWRVIDSSSGLLLCENVIDSGCFYYYLDPGAGIIESDYASSNLNSRLGIIYSDSLNENEKQLLDDNGFFALNAKEASNTKHGFSFFKATKDIARKATATDYAKSRGVFVDNSGFAWWWLKTDVNGTKADVVHRDGSITVYEKTGTDIGIRPAIRIKKG